MSRVVERVSRGCQEGGITGMRVLQVVKRVQVCRRFNVPVKRVTRRSQQHKKMGSRADQRL